MWSMVSVPKHLCASPYNCHTSDFISKCHKFVLTWNRIAKSWLQCYVTPHGYHSCCVPLFLSLRTKLVSRNDEWRLQAKTLNFCSWIGRFWPSIELRHTKIYILCIIVCSSWNYDLEWAEASTHWHGQKKKIPCYVTEMVISGFKQIDLCLLHDNTDCHVMRVTSASVSVGKCVRIKITVILFLFSVVFPFIFHARLRNHASDFVKTS